MEKKRLFISEIVDIKNKKGELTYDDKNTSNYWAIKLWSNTKPSWA